MGGESIASKVRPPKWVSDSRWPGSMLRMAMLLQMQTKYLDFFKSCAELNNWAKLQRDHFDWWIFPIDDSSRPEYNLYSEDDIGLLRSDPIWLNNYRESVRIIASSWGWDVEDSCRIPNGGAWNHHDVRLAKVIRSLWLFEITEYFNSMQEFARSDQKNEKGGRGFHYGRINLDEMLYMRLPRL